MLGIFLFGVASCQLFTGTYNADGGTLGPSCTAVAICCPSLTGNAATACLTYAELEMEPICTAFLQTFPNGVCAAQHDAGLLLFFDSGTHVDANSSLPRDAGHDSTMSDPLNGTWTLSSIECNGQAVGLNGTTSITFSGTTVQEVDTLSDGCVITTSLSPATITTSDITSAAGSVSCGAFCTTNDTCAPETTGAASDPYTLLGGVLTIRLPDSSCSAGTVNYLWTQN